jgi:DeoR/GlpR family transcriptional regulator of sugar metabolism
MIPAQRREILMRHLRQEKVLSVKELTQLLSVSTMTVYRDIAALEREGLALSTTGGVRLPSDIYDEPPFTVKAEQNQREKAAIARAASELLHDNMVIYMDAGTTTGALAPYVRAHSGLTVITNDFSIVEELSPVPSIQLIHVGGNVEVDNRSTSGPLAAATASRLNTDIAFISTSSWDITHGVTTPSQPKVGLKSAAIERTSLAVLMASSSKFGSFGVYTIRPLTAFDRVITDAGLSSNAASGLRDLGIPLQIVPLPPEGDEGE